MPFVSHGYGDREGPPSHERALSQTTEFSSHMMVAWYCFIATAVIPILLCSIYIWYVKYSSHRRAQAALQLERQMEEDDIVLSRIEANVQKFSEAEKLRRTRMVRAEIRKHVRCLQEDDVENQPCSLEGKSLENDVKSCDEDNAKLSRICTICLEEMKVGEAVARASHHACPHIFHEECIVSWLVARQNNLCPCCRQVYCTGFGTRIPRPSLTSVDPLTSVDQLSTSTAELCDS